MRRRKLIKPKGKEITLAEMKRLRAEIEESQSTQEYRWHSDLEIERALKVCGGFRSEAARLLNISPAAISHRLKKSKRLSNFMENLLEEMLDKAEKKLDEALDAGQPWAIQFLLRSKGRGRNWGEKQHLEVEGKVPSGLLVVPAQLPPSQWERIARAHQAKLLGEDNGDDEVIDGDYEETEQPIYDQPPF